jgi:hypothetical protein
MLRTGTTVTFALMLAGLAQAADGVDPLTGLPIPDAASGMSLSTPMRLDPGQVCKSTLNTQFYSPSGFKTSAAIAWYGAHLKGFRHLHGYGAGRTQDLFVNADGTMYIGITGSPGADGVDTEIYAISYATLKPGMPDKQLQGLLSQRLTC